MVACFTALVILTSPGVAVRLDGRPVAAGAETRVRPGEHEVELRQADDRSTFLVRAEACVVTTVQVDL